MVRQANRGPTPEHLLRQATAGHKVTLLLSIADWLADREWDTDGGEPVPDGWVEARDQLVRQFNAQADRITRERLQ